MKAHNKRMQSDQSARYARTLAADARRYDRFWPKADIRQMSTPSFFGQKWSIKNTFMQLLFSYVDKK